MSYSDYKYFQLRFDSGVAFVSINHPPINLLDEVLSQEFDKLGRELETDESVRVVVVQSAIPDFFIAHSGLGRVGRMIPSPYHHAETEHRQECTGQQPTYAQLASQSGAPFRLASHSRPDMGLDHSAYVVLD